MRRKCIKYIAGTIKINTNKDGTLNKEDLVADLASYFDLNDSKFDKLRFVRQCTQ